MKRAGVRRPAITLIAAGGILASALPVLGTLLPPGDAAFHCQAAGNIWLGFLFYYGIFILFYFFGWLIVWMMRKTRNNKKKDSSSDRAGRSNIAGLDNKAGLRRENKAALDNKAGPGHVNKPGHDNKPGRDNRANPARDKKPARDSAGIRGGHKRAAILLSVMAAAAAGVNICGYFQAHRVVTTQYTVNSDKSFLLPEGKKKLRIVLFSDLHLSVNSTPKLTKDMVRRVNAADADLAVFGGDLFTSTYDGLKDPEKYVKVLRKIKAKYGVYAVYGNHDTEEKLFGGFPITSKDKAFRNPKMTRFMKESGFRILDDDAVSAAGGTVWLIGRRSEEKPGDGTDRRKPVAALLRGKGREALTIVAEHEPVRLGDLSRYNVDLVLSGHTHDGQIFPGNYVTSWFNDNSYGLKKFGKTWSLVSSGVGYYGPPVRVGTRSEVTVIDFVSKQGNK